MTSHHGLNYDLVSTKLHLGNPVAVEQLRRAASLLYSWQWRAAAASAAHASTRSASRAVTVATSSSEIVMSTCFSAMQGP
jgi:hypothetical protein